jgi:hypothetical protein
MGLSPGLGKPDLFSLLTRWFWGRHVKLPAYFLTGWIFLRTLGVIYLVAFVSLWTQSNGWIGHNGILPAGQFMAAPGGTRIHRGILAVTLTS